MLMFSVLFLISSLTYGSGLLIVETNYGKIRGITDFSDKDNYKYMFKGIPFVKPPLGNLRFELPQKIEPWNNILDASKYSPACMSNSSLTSTPQADISEDCLYINIFTSQRCLTKKCSVIVYFHGGSFSLDSATMFPDRFILDRYAAEDIVFVIPAFRLGVFGQFFLGNSSVVSENLLLYDCLAALEFVNTEIQFFGGDPNDVTIMGHSSGGSTIDALGFSDQVDPSQKYFQKLIVLSAHGYFGVAELKINASLEIASRFGCSSESQQEIVDCMRNKDARDIIRIQREMDEKENISFRSMLLTKPITGANGTISQLKKNAPPRKMLCGVTEHELEKYNYRNNHMTGTFLDFENADEVISTYRNKIQNKTTGWVNSDTAAIFVSAATYSEALVNAGGEVYLFETRQKPYSMHVSDMQYFVGIHREKEHTSDMDILDSFYSKLLVNFTKYGEPSPNWEKFDPARKNFLVLEVDTELGIGPRMEDGFHEELVDFWLINMTMLDKQITLEKKQSGEDVSTKPTELSLIENATHVETDEPDTTDEFLEITSILPTEFEAEDEFLIYNQWWFYAIVLFVFLVLVFVFIVLKRSANPRDEQIPLLG